MRLITLALSTFICCANALASDPINAALEHAARPSADIEQDAKRRPDQVLRFFELQPGMKVLDMFAGGGYYTELTAYVVGNAGKVDALNNQAYINYVGPEKIHQRFADNRLPNVSVLTQETDALDLPADYYDRIWFFLSFHDLYHVDAKNGWQKIDDARFMQTLRRALKDDGIIAITDHAALPGTPDSSGQELHRIDPQLIKDRMQQWGFVLVKEGDFLQNLDDPMTIPMWDPSVRGRTNRVVMAFSKK